MSTQTQAAVERMIFRKTNAQTGRHVSVTPQNSTMRHLAYGRVILNLSKPSISFPNGDRETGLICLSGKATVKAASQEFELGRNSMRFIFHAIHRLKSQRVIPWTSLNSLPKSARSIH